jgi:uncharacterized protein (TIGR03000 family)
MLKFTLSFAKIAILASALLFTTAGQSQAQRHGGHGGGWHGGGYHGGYHGSYYNHGGWGGHYGYGGGWGIGLGYYPYYGRYWGGYPYYGGYWGGYYTPYASYYTPYYYPETWTPNYMYPVTAVTPAAYQSYYPSDSVVPASNTTNTATVTLTVPSPTAEVWFGDHKTSQTGTTRQFVTPPLTPGQTFTYDIRATWMDNGQPVTQTRQVRVEAGKASMVDFTQQGQ